LPGPRLSGGPRDPWEPLGERGCRSRGLSQSVRKPGEVPRGIGVLHLAVPDRGERSPPGPQASVVRQRRRPPGGRSARAAAGRRRRFYSRDAGEAPPEALGRVPVDRGPPRHRGHVLLGHRRNAGDPDRHGRVETLPRPPGTAHALEKVEGGEECTVKTPPARWLRGRIRPISNSTSPPATSAAPSPKTS